jgi:hypothetical protein
MLSLAVAKDVVLNAGESISSLASSLNNIVSKVAKAESVKPLGTVPNCSASSKSAS